MCGRYTNTITDPEVIAQAFDLETPPPATDLQARYNIAPSQQVMTIGKNADGHNSVAWMRWGLIPSWAKERSIGNKMINARAETLAEKPSFRTAYRKRRCLVVADGFYEWRKNPDKTKTPMYVRLANQQVFGLAGLWGAMERQRKQARKLFRVPLSLEHPTKLIKPLHHRMAVILPKENYETWLSRDIEDTDLLQHLLQPYPAEAMEVYPVSTLVNNVANDGPELTLRAE